ncbi:SpoIIE family protein phosphatase [Streptomyces sp. NPDC059862]|uniref:SpoIIE family protein phosphatase n=1 Tax=Streptomyces sp. NPDC059862 TaxID=3346975 RepID=UPI003665435F
MDGFRKLVDRRACRLTSADADMAATVAVTDRDGRVTCWSSEAEDLLGYTAADIIGRPVTDLLSADDTVLHRDGHPLDVQVHLRPLLDAEGETGFLLTAQRRANSAEQPAGDALVQCAFDHLPTPFALYDREARLQQMNLAMTRISGYNGEEEVRGKFLTEFLHPEAYENIERRIFRVLESGKPESFEPFVRAPGEPRAHAWAIDVFPLRDAAGRTQGAGLAASDYSQQYDSRERLALLSEARTRIGTSLEVAGTAQELAEVAVPRFADVVAVDLLEPVSRGDLPAPVLTGPVQLRRAALQTASRIAWDRLAPGEISRHPASSPIARCLATGRAVLHRLADPEVVRWFTEDPAQGAQARACGAHSLIAVPIRARGAILGAALFVRCATTRDRFGPDCLAVTEDLVARAAICLDNARRFTHERDIALALQRALLPHGLTEHQAAETAARYLPAGGGAQAGGDWFDVIDLPGARIGLVVGDVVGHGINASATMGRLRTAVRTLADIDLPPDELLTHLDDIVSHTDDEQGADATGDIPGDVGARCLYAVYDPLPGTCTLARAGHPAPLLVHPDGTSTVVDLPLGPPLGLGSLPFEATEMTLPEGSLLALFTDGLVTGRDHDIDERLSTLRRALAQPTSSLDTLCDAVLDALHPEPHTDDIALLLARTHILDEDHVASWDIPVDPAAVAQARRRAGDQLAAWGLEEAAFITELIVSELVTNAIRHASGPIRLTLIKDETLICEVSDGSSTSPHLRRARVYDEGGRGLYMVAELTQRWGTRYIREGKTIWAEQLIPTPEERVPVTGGTSATAVRSSGLPPT